MRIVDIALGDNDIEIQRNLLQEMLNAIQKSTSLPERPLRQAAMGKGVIPETPLTVVSFLSFTSGVSRVEAGKSDYGCQRSNGPARGTGAAEYIRQLQGQSVSDKVSPPILVMTPKNADREHIRRSLSPGDFVRFIFLSAHISG